MIRKKNNGLSLFLFLLITGSVFAAVISSCGKNGNVSPTALNIRYQVVNLSPDVGPIALYIQYHNYNNRSYYYPSASGYFYLTLTDTPFQIRPGQSIIPGQVVPTTNIVPNLDYILKPNLRYTLFIGGTVANNNVQSLFLTDTSSLPATGRGKVRFVNVSPQQQNYDVVANGTLAFANQAFMKVSPYIEIPSGSYNFQIFNAGTTTPVIGTLQNVNILDGRLYTIYTYGLAGQTDSLAFGGGVIANN
ncbi:MAG TPA: DUF4397 domain-containing protein [Mucilaginibacter sp.]|nr:DUF4397 domain-containing protein [Mucilaginibacter sp.]